MARRSRKGGSNNKWLILIQIAIMAGVLVFIIFFRDTIGSGASSAFDTVAGTEDIEVEGEGASDESPSSAPRGTEGEDASSDESADSDAGGGTTPDDQ